MENIFKKLKGGGEPVEIGQYTVLIRMYTEFYSVVTVVVSSYNSYSINNSSVNL